VNRIPICLKVPLLVLAITLAACETPAWTSAPLQHTCSEEQSVRVEQETRFCNENTDYLSAYCYGAAIARNCDRIAEKN
jgi:hypothetical protein